MGLKNILMIFIGLIFILGCQKETQITKQSREVQDTTAVVEQARPEETPQKVLASLTYSQRKGKLLYEHYCAVCHGETGKGDGFNSYNLNPRPRDLTEPGYLDSITDDWLMEIISQGGRGVKRSVLMPSYENTLTKKQIRDIIDYLRYLARSQKSSLN